MTLDALINNLPSEVIKNGHFCFTGEGTKFPRDVFTYEKIGANSINATFEDVKNSPNLSVSECVGLRIANSISAIDIDHCVNSQTGEFHPFAIKIINFMQSYTELSPSGTGVRILFNSLTPFSLEQYKVKIYPDSKAPELCFEYYDSVYQETKAARMVRLSGNRIFKKYDYRSVDTSEILDEYMKRPVNVETRLATTGHLNEKKCKYILEITKHNPDFIGIYSRSSTSFYKSESDWDFILCTKYFEFTQVIDELIYLFENNRYFLTKKNVAPKFHQNKYWKRGYKQILFSIRFPVDNKYHYMTKYANLFDSYQPYENRDIEKELFEKFKNEIATISRELKVIRMSQLKEFQTAINLDDQDLINIIWFIVHHRRHILKLYDGTMTL